MTPDGERLVRETLPLIQQAAPEVARAFYERLFALDPEARGLFAHVDMERQGAKFSMVLASIVRSLDAPPRFVADVAALGRRHVSYGVRGHHYESVGAALVWSVEAVLGPACTPEVRAAWAEAYALIAAVMRRACERRCAATTELASSGTPR
jgi:hemoglobin-like flavoprotein